MMTTPVQGAGQLQTFKLSDLGMKKEAEILLAKETVETADGQVEALVFDSQEEALKHAGRDTGDEAIVKTADGRWAVVDLKSTAQQVQKLDPALTAKDQFNQLKIKAEAIFDPGAEVAFPDRILSRTRVYNDGNGYKETGMDRLEVLPSSGSTPQKQADRALQLAHTAVAGKVGGFNESLMSNSVKGEMYKANLVTVIGQLDQGIQGLSAKYASLETEVRQGLEAREKALHGEGVVDPWLNDKIKDLQTLGAQIEDLKTHRGVLSARLLVASQGGGEIPGQNADEPALKIGANRNNFGEVREALLQRKGQLQDVMKRAQTPEVKASLQAQIDLVDQEYTHNVKTEGEVKAAALAIRMRTGALATTSKALGDASTSLQAKTARFAALNQELITLTTDPQRGPEGPRQKVADIRKELETLKKEIETEKAALITTMESELKVFSQNGPRAKEAQAFLQSQIDEVRGLSLTDPAKAKAEAEKLNALQSKMLTVLKAKAQIWEGISPQEGKMLAEIDTKVNSYISDYKAAKAEAGKLEARVELAEHLPAFGYTARPLDSVADARDKWTPGSSEQSGVEANKIINETYDHLDGQFDKYLGEPRLANWMTFGKYASREAGTQIQNLEAALEALETFKKVDFSTANDQRAAQALVKVLMSDRMLEQAVRMALEVSNDVSSVKVGELLLAGLAGTGAIKGVEFAGKMIDALGGLRTAMVKGNTRIYENIARPFDVFMQAEARGENGLDALKAAGYAPPRPPQTFTTDKVKDPQGYVLGAFTKYKEAKNIWDKVQILQKEDPVGNKAQIETLMAQRKDLIHNANLMIGMQEQLTILQAPDIFGDPMVKRLLGAMSGTMSLTDANGRHELLPGSTPATANWADFATRMGLKDVPEGTPGALPARMPDGSTHHYVPTYPTGTISEYFQSNLDGKGAAHLIDSPPRDIKPIYQDRTDGQVTWSDRAWDGVLIVSPAVGIGKKLVDLIF